MNRGDILFIARLRSTTGNGLRKAQNSFNCPHGEFYRMEKF